MRFDLLSTTPHQVVQTYDEDVEMDRSDDEKSSGNKIVTRWNVQPLRKLETDVYPTPPTEALRASESEDRTHKKTRRRRPGRPSKS